MGTNAQQKPDALEFWHKHGLNDTRYAFKVSRSTLHRWRKAYRETGLITLYNRTLQENFVEYEE